MSSVLNNCRAFGVLQECLNEGRLPHSLLLYGKNQESLEEATAAIAGLILSAGDRDPLMHPDFFSIRPSNKKREISVGNTRDLIKKINLSPNQGSVKVAVIFEADRLNVQSSNAFLKTLEEPPKNTTILLVSTRPYSLLDTIRSRCLKFNINVEDDGLKDPAWENWLKLYDDWMETAVARKSDKAAIARQVIGIYGLITQFQAIQASIASAIWEERKEKLPENIPDDNVVALEVGTAKSVRQQLLADVEQRTYQYVRRKNDFQPNAISAAKFQRVVDLLERSVGLLEVNLNEATAMESFFLSSLRIWAA